MRSASSDMEDLQARLAHLEAQIAKKQGKADRQSASIRTLMREIAEIKVLIETQEKGS